MLLVIPQNYTSTFSFPFLGIMYLASVLKAEGHEVEILDCQTNPRYMDRLISGAEKHDTVGFYINFLSAEDVRNMATGLREVFPEKRIIVGGPYPNYDPEKVLRSYADIVVLGEGEEVLKRIASGEDLPSIPSLVYKTPDGEILRNSPTSGWIDLDSLPFPDWNMVDYRRYSSAIFLRRPVVSIQSSRGCPQSCIYCTKLIHGHKVRRRSVENVVDELEYDHNRFGIPEVHFMDDNFTVSVPRVKEICEEIIRRGLNKRMRFAVPIGIRPDLGDREMFKLMARAGFYYVAIAVESGNPEVSSKLNRNVNLDRVPQTIRFAKEAGLIVATFWIFGTPFDTISTMRDSIDFACRSDANIMSIFFLVTFPGTKLYYMLCDEGKIDPETYGSLNSIISMDPRLEANDWTKEDLVRLRRYAGRRFYLSPKRLFMNLFNKTLVLATLSSLPRIVLNLFLHGRPTSSAKRSKFKA